MKKKTRFAAASLIMLFLLSGCIEMDVKVKVNPDGSGEIVEEILYGPQLTMMIKSFAGKDTTGKSPFLDEEKLKSEAAGMGEGVKYVKGEELDKLGKKGYRAVYSFNDVTKLHLKQDPSSKAPMGGSGAPKTGTDKNITFDFEKNGNSRLIVNLPKNMQKELDFGGNKNGADTSGFGNLGEEMLAMMADMKMKFSVMVNGDIAETNATHREGNSFTIMSLDLSEIIKEKEDYKKLQELSQKSAGEAKELIKKLPGFTIEFENPMVIEFE